MTKINEQELETLIESNKRAFILDKCKSTKDFLKVFLDEMNIKVGYCEYKKDGHDIDFQFIESRFVDWCQCNEIKGKAYQAKALQSAMNILEDEARSDIIESIKQDVAFKKNNEWEKLQKLTQFTNFDITILQSFVYNVKRAILDLPREQSPMPILYSFEQGSGKSTFNKALYSPVRNFAQLMNLDDLGDKFGIGRFSQTFVADFDDISQFNHKNLETFKKFAFAEKLSARGIFSSKISTFVKKSQCIGSSNKPINEVVKDETGNRRMWPINLKCSLLPAINKINFLKLWQAIDEHSTCPIMVGDNFARIKDIQLNKLRYKSELEIWFEEFLAENYESSLTSDQLYRIYCNWCDSGNVVKLNKISWGRKLAVFGDKFTKRRSNRGNVYDFLLKNRIKLAPDVDEYLNKCA